MQQEPMDAGLAAEKLDGLAKRSERWRRWSRAKRPKAIADVVAQVIAKRGYGARQTNKQLAEAWAKAAGTRLARRSQAVRINRGRLEVTVASSTVMQELTFEKQRILQQLAELLPDAKINDLKARVGKLD